MARSNHLLHLETVTNNGGFSEKEQAKNCRVDIIQDITIILLILSSTKPTTL